MAEELVGKKHKKLSEMGSNLAEGIAGLAEDKLNSIAEKKDDDSSSSSSSSSSNN